MSSTFLTLNPDFTTRYIYFHRNLFPILYMGDRHDMRDLTLMKVVSSAGLEPATFVLGISVSIL
jgi:hypothetical protein